MSSRDTDPLTLADYAVTVRLQDAAALFTLLGTDPLRGSNWIFRGQRYADWAIEPKLERFARTLNERPDAIEGFAVGEFKRQAHHYAKDLPILNDLEWLALMRHHGSPTRLVDFSRSPYVAALCDGGGDGHGQRGDLGA
jgi:hypothetical protein